MAKRPTSRKIRLVKYYLVFLTAGAYLGVSGYFESRNGEPIDAGPRGGLVHLTGQGAAQYARGQLTFGILLILVALTGILGQLLRRRP